MILITGITGLVGSNASASF